MADWNNRVLLIHDDTELAFELASILSAPDFINVMTPHDEERRQLSELTDTQRRDAILAASKDITASAIDDASAVFALWKGGSKFLGDHRDPLLAALAQHKLVIALAHGEKTPLGFDECPINGFPLSPPDILVSMRMLPHIRVTQITSDRPLILERAQLRHRRWSPAFTVIAVIAAIGSALFSLGAGLKVSLSHLVIACLLALGLYLFFVASNSVIRSRQTRQHQERALRDFLEPNPEGSIFVSYARVDAPKIDPLLLTVENSGVPLWVDRRGMLAARGWAGQLVNAIRRGAGTIVICSEAAFRSDNVAREIYLSAHFKKPIGPVFIEDVTPPDELLYFLIRPQHMRLFEVAESDRPARLKSYIETIQ